LNHLNNFKDVLFWEAFDDEKTYTNWRPSLVPEYDGELIMEETFPPPLRKNERGLIQKSRNTKHAISCKLQNPFKTSNQI
jgi:hypothetical protein